jgi:hypothetical protein
MLSLRKRITLIVVIGLVCAGGPSLAQDLEPRAYTASPVGLNFLVVGGGRLSGDVIFDTTIPVTDVHASANTVNVGAGRTFSFFGRTALAVASFPYAWATASGSVGETGGSISRSGLADPRMKLSVNLVGGRAVTVRDFAKVERPTIVGVSVVVVPPLGQYDPNKLINLGSNRWSFKPEAGVSRLAGKWTFDGYAGVWLFTANRKYFTSSRVRTQEPVVTIQGHTSYSFKPRLWAAFDATWYSGGQTAVDGNDQGNIKSSMRIGATMSVPLSLRQSVKVAYGRGATTRVGANFTTISAAWQLSWVD